VLAEHALLLRFDDDRLLIVNLGPAFRLDVAPEPLLAAPPGTRWELLWTSESGAFDVTTIWSIPAEVALLLQAVGYTHS
jgi:hypothetical protein